MGVVSMGQHWGPSDSDWFTAAVVIVGGSALVGSLLTLAVQLAWRLWT